MATTLVNLQANDTFPKKYRQHALNTYYSESDDSGASPNHSAPISSPQIKLQVHQIMQTFKEMELSPLQPIPSNIYDNDSLSDDTNSYSHFDDEEQSISETVPAVGSYLKFNNTKYYIRELLSNSHSGYVYLAEKIPNNCDESDDDDAELCVIKLIKRVPENDRAQSDMVNDQIAAMDRCNTSEHIISLLDCGTLYTQTGHYYVLILDYCNGGTFQEYLQNFPGHVLSEYEAYFWFQQLMKICRDLIHCGVIHRDIKPQNLFVHFNGYNSLPTLKLANFSLSKIQSEMHSCTNTFIVDEEDFTHIAPEYLSENGYDNAVDIWAIGVVLYKMVNTDNRPPFAANNISDMFGEMMHHKIKMPPNISPKLEHLLTGMFAKFVQQRYKFNDIYSSEWCRYQRYNRLPKVIEMRKFLISKSMPKTDDLNISFFGDFESAIRHNIQISQSDGDFSLCWGGENNDEYAIFMDMNGRQSINVSFGDKRRRKITEYYSPNALPLTMIPKYMSLYKFIQKQRHKQTQAMVNIIYTKNHSINKHAQALSYRAVMYQSNDIAYINGETEIFLDNSTEKLHFRKNGIKVGMNNIDQCDFARFRQIEYDINRGRLAHIVWEKKTTIKYDIDCKVYYQ